MPTPNDPPTDVECLQVGMTMSNPQLDVIVVNTSVKNNCGIALSDIRLSWDSTVVCNGRYTNGPHDNESTAYLGNGQTASWSDDYSAICYSSQWPYYPTNYQIEEYAEAFATYSATQDAFGQHSTPWYTFL